MLADLPAIRFEKPEKDPRPFRNVGVDYIGSVFNTYKTHRERIYICLFTCLTKRTKHLESKDCLSIKSVLQYFGVLLIEEDFLIKSCQCFLICWARRGIEFTLSEIYK